MGNDREIERIRRRIGRLFGLDPYSMANSSDLYDDLGLESPEVETLVEHLEDMFGVTLDCGTLSQVRTVKDLEQCVKGALASS